MEGIKAVAFDIDGTLYPDSSLYVRVIFYFLKNLKFFLRYNKVRKIMHRTAPLGDFYEYQARLLAQMLGTDSESAKKEINDKCYEGLKRYFKKVKPYADAYETVNALKEAGYKIAILSDFPPDQKGSLWGIRNLCDVCLGSEETGALKPSKYPFGILARTLELKPEEILYVGNSIKYDVRGSKNAGMKSAYIMSPIKRLFNIKCREADISFRNYSELKKILLQ